MFADEVKSATCLAERRENELTEDYQVAAIRTLDRTNPDHWNLLGKPQIGVLEELLGYHLSGEERDRAWERFLRVDGVVAD